MADVAPILLGILLLFVAAEVVWSKLQQRNVYNLKESLGNFAILGVNNLIKPISYVWSFFVFSLAEPFQIVSLPETGLVFLVTFLVVDCAYYWFHRLSHEIPFLWTMHHTHHSSPWMNLTTAVRLNWVAKFISPLFFLPLIVLGIPANWLVASLAIGLFFQFFLHTQAVGRLGWFEGKLFNTPAAHRVHHGSNSQYIDKNFAGALIIWDRLFGTYEPEVEPVKYGVTTGFVSHNPFVIQLRPLWAYLRGEWRTEKQTNYAGTAALPAIDKAEQPDYQLAKAHRVR